MVNAVIWDYDGTLVDTRRKNFSVMREIMREVLRQSPREYDILQSIEQYQTAIANVKNWEELYKKHFQLSDAQISQAGAMWKTYQMSNETKVPLFNDIQSVLKNLSTYKQGIVSQNASENITAFLKERQLDRYFSKIIGYEDIGYDRQKPDPTGLTNCIQHLTDFEPGAVLYIGDHETDMQCAHAADQQFSKDGRELRVFSVAACYGFATNTNDWIYQPDFKAHASGDIIEIIDQLAG